MPKQNVSPTAYPQAVLQEIERLAQNIVVARKRRGETQLQWARKLGVSQPTMARIERGDPSVAMASYVMCLWLINPTVGLADLVAPANDHAALEREVRKVRQKLRSQTPNRLQKSPANSSNEVRLSGARKTPEIQESARTAASVSVDVREDLAKTTISPDLGLSAAGQLAKLRKSQLGLSTGSGLSDIHKSLEQTTNSPGLGLSTADQLAKLRKSHFGLSASSGLSDVHKSLEQSNPIAKGLSSLLQKRPKKSP